MMPVARLGVHADGVIIVKLEVFANTLMGASAGQFDDTAMVGNTQLGEGSTASSDLHSPRSFAALILKSPGSTAPAAATAL
ncbi:hypothetical protein MJ585_16830 [Klebsiella pneumoniae]|nr:hypothetical protein MJ585_16830 [Klebsiella pneumoniae]